MLRHRPVRRPFVADSLTPARDDATAKDDDRATRRPTRRRHEVSGGTIRNESSRRDRSIDATVAAKLAERPPTAAAHQDKPPYPNEKLCPWQPALVRMFDRAVIKTKQPFVLTDNLATSAAPVLNRVGRQVHAAPLGNDRPTHPPNPKKMNVPVDQIMQMPVDQPRPLRDKNKVQGPMPVRLEARDVGRNGRHRVARRESPLTLVEHDQRAIGQRLPGPGIRDGIPTVTDRQRADRRIEAIDIAEHRPASPHCGEDLTERPKRLAGARLPGDERHRHQPNRASLLRTIIARFTP
jgi:hypothetical protein